MASSKPKEKPVSGPVSDTFKTLAEILEYITGSLGKKLSIAKLKRDSAARVLPRQKDGTWSREKVDAYAALLPVKIDGKSDAPKGSSYENVRAEELTRIKLEREIEKMEAQTRSINFKNAVEEGKYFRKNDVWLELASRAAILYQGLQQDLLAAVPSIVQASRESEDRVEMVVRGAIERALDLAINQFSRPMTLDVETWDGTVEEEKDGDAGDTETSD